MKPYHARFWLARALGALAALVIGTTFLAPTAQASYVETYVTYRDPGPDMLVGYLAAAGTERTIAWDSPGSQEDSVAAGTTDEFMGAPLARAIPINVSRDLELDVNVAGFGPRQAGQLDACSGSNNEANPMLDIQILFDGKRFAGIGEAGVVIDYKGQRPTTMRPADPAGYTTCRFRMHSEADVLPAGARISIILRVVSSSGPVEYGLATEHPSVLRIPFYPSEEWALRNPVGHVGQNARSSFQPQQGAEGVAAAMTLGGLVLLAGRGRRGKPPWAIAFLLASGALAGCTSSSGAGGDDAAPTGGTAEASFVPDDSILTSNGTGSIVGFVHDDQFEPVAGVHVSGRGLANFDDTDRHGRFTFARLIPGEYRLRFEASEYRTFETDAEVRQGFINRLEVTLTILANITGDQRRHPHDYWLESSSKEVYNQSLGINCYKDLLGTQECQPFTDFYSEPGPFTTILPGTYDIEVRIRGDPDYPPPTGVTLAVNANNEGGPNGWNPLESDQYNWTLLYPRPPGEPYHVRVNWEMTDVGHQPFSTVHFALMAHGASLGDPMQQFNNFMFGSDYEWGASVRVHKGVVPLEPRHPDPWGTNNSLRVLDSAPWETAFPPGIVVGGASQEWVPTRIVPPGTQWLEVYANRSRAPFVAPYTWNLEFTDGTAPLTYVYPEGYTLAPPPTDAGLSHRWRVPIEAGHEDFFYSKHTSFRFRISTADATLYAADVAGETYRSDTLEMSLAVIAHRTPMPGA